MRYYSEEDLKVPLHYRRQILETAKPIEISFCHDCPLFEANYWQPNPETQVEGWCRGRSYYRTFEDELPVFFYTNSNSFCDKRTVVNDEQFMFSAAYRAIFSMV